MLWNEYIYCVHGKILILCNPCLTQNTQKCIYHTVSHCIHFIEDMFYLFQSILWIKLYQPLGQHWQQEAGFESWYFIWVRPITEPGYTRMPAMYSKAVCQTWGWWGILLVQFDCSEGCSATVIPQQIFSYTSVTQICQHCSERLQWKKAASWTVSVKIQHCWDVKQD